jgi:hypothetical protein
MRKIKKFLVQGISPIVTIIIVAIIGIIVASSILTYIYLWHPAEPPNIAPDETADWKTYRNEQYGFEIKFPADYVIVKENRTGADFYPENYADFPDQNLKDPWSEAYVAINIAENPDDLTVEKYYGGNPDWIFFDGDGEVFNKLINGQNVTVFSPSETYGIEYYYFLSLDKKIVYISCVNENENICESMLASFKFI